MQDFIQMATKNLGIPEGKARSATSGLLQMIQKQTNQGDFQQLLGKLPGATDLLKTQPADAKPATEAGGMLGGLAGQVASAVGGKAGAALGLMGALQQSGLNVEKAGPFVSLFLQFIQQKAGSGLMDRIVGQVPELKNVPG